MAWPGGEGCAASGGFLPIGDRENGTQCSGQCVWYPQAEENVRGQIAALSLYLSPLVHMRGLWFPPPVAAAMPLTSLNAQHCVLVLEMGVPASAVGVPSAREPRTYDQLGAVAPLQYMLLTHVISISAWPL